MGASRAIEMLVPPGQLRSPAARHNSYFFSVITPVVRKASRLSAEKVTSFLPVARAPAVPAPAPDAAPIAAPLPPPAIAPMAAPTAVPPPISVTLRFLWLPPVAETDVVLMGTRRPSTSIESSVSLRYPGFWSLPDSRAETTWPCTRAPFSYDRYPVFSHWRRQFCIEFLSGPGRCAADAAQQAHRNPGAAGDEHRGRLLGNGFGDSIRRLTRPAGVGRAAGIPVVDPLGGFGLIGLNRLSALSRTTDHYEQRQKQRGNHYGIARAQPLRRPVTEPQSRPQHFHHLRFRRSCCCHELPFPPFGDRCAL